MAEKPLKILVCGEVSGKFNQVFNRIRNILKKNTDFECLLCVGSFFSSSEASQMEWKQYLDGQATAPLATYILGPNSTEEVKFFESVSLEDGGELCQNVTYLGRRGLLATEAGLQIAYLSGMDKEQIPESGCFFTESDVQALMETASEEKFKGVDILLTSTWPRNVTQFAKQLENADAESTSSPQVSKLALKLKPRYHFSSSPDIFYERLPYRNHRVLKEQAAHVTRFLSLASATNTTKQKYLYAFNVKPLTVMDKSELTSQPDGTTECPYRRMGQGAATPSSDKNPSSSNQQFFFDMSQQKGQKRKHDQGAHDRGPRNQGAPAQPKQPCWFCLGSESVQKHLVVSVGEQNYIALAKGGLTADHVLVCPIAHFRSTVEMPMEMCMEIEKYKQALIKMFRSKGQSCVIFERNFRSSHLQLQVLGIPKSKIEEAKELFMELANEYKMDMRELSEKDDLRQVVKSGIPYFVAEFEDGVRLFHRVNKSMPLQFGREALATVLSIPERVDWRECSASEDEEKKMAAEFRAKFQPFDFSAL